MSQARNTTIQSIEEHGNENCHGGLFEVPIHRLDDGIETGKQRRRRQQIRQEINASSPNFRIHQGFAWRMWLHG